MFRNALLAMLLVSFQILFLTPLTINPSSNKIGNETVVSSRSFSNSESTPSSAYSAKSESPPNQPNASDYDSHQRLVVEAALLIDADEPVVSTSPSEAESVPPSPQLTEKPVQVTLKSQPVADTVQKEPDPQPATEPAPAPTQKPVPPPEPTAAPTTAPTTPPEPEPPVPQPSNSLIEEIRSLTNQARVAAGLSPLAGGGSIDQAAALRASELPICTAHQRPDGRPFYSVLAEFDLTAKACAENFACATAGCYSATDIVNGWLASDGHRKNIMDSQYTQIGIGYVESGGTAYYVQIFVG